MQLPSSVCLQKHQDVDVLQINNDLASASISLFGGHLLSFTPHHDKRERIWLSEQAIFDNQTPIRGGVPVCWPWFSNAHNQNRDDLPSHGFVRTQPWTIKSITEENGGTRVVLAPEQSAGPGWAYQCDLTLTFDINKELRISLETLNTGESSFSLNCALHSYFKVDDIAQIELTGLAGQYRDKTKHWQEFDTPSPYQVSEETDRIHLSPCPSIEIVDNHTTTVKSQGHDSIVVWNPWAQNSIKMRDMSDDGYKTMICVETAITQTKVVKPNERVLVKQVIV